MKTLAIKAVVTSPTGFFYREEHEWHNIDDKMSVWFGAKLDETAKYIDRASKNKAVGPLSAVLSSVVDGVVQPSLSVSGFTYGELSKFQRMWAKIGDELIGHGEEHAKKKG